MVYALKLGYISELMKSVSSIFISLIFCFQTVSLAETKTSASQFTAKLQWFDEAGSIIDLNWPLTYQLEWVTVKFDKGNGVVPGMLVSIQVPEQIHIIDNDSSLFIKNENAHQVMSFVSHSLLTSRKIKYALGSESPKTVGLMLSFAPQSTELLVHESCQKENIFLRKKDSDLAKVFFVGISCKKEKKTIQIYLTLPNESFSSLDSSPLKSYGQLKTLEYTLQLPISGEVVKSFDVSKKQGQPSTKVEIYYQATPLAPANDASNGVINDALKKSEVSSKTQSHETETSVTKPKIKSEDWVRNFNVDLLLTHFFYTTQGNGRDDASEYQLKALFKSDFAPFGEDQLNFEGRMYFPAFVILNRPFYIPASGAYGLGLAAKLFLTQLFLGWDFYFSPGVFSEYVYLSAQSALSGWRTGPDLTLVLKENAASPLRQQIEFNMGLGFGRPEANGISVWQTSVKYLVAALDFNQQNKLSLVTGLSFQRLLNGSFNSIDETALSVGVRLNE